MDDNTNNAPVAPPQDAAAPAQNAVPATHGPAPVHHERAQIHGGASAPHSGGQAQGEKPAPTALREPNTIFIGKKSVMAYVLAVVSQFNNGSPFVKLKARGKIISRAVDVAEIVKHRFISTAHPKEINISTEDLQSEDGTMTKVSSIEIILVK